MHRLTTAAFVAVVSALFASVSTPAMGAVIGSYAGTWTASETTQLGRIYRDGVPSDGTGSKTFPGGMNLTTSYGIRLYTFHNAGPAAVFDLQGEMANNASFFTAWQGGAYDLTFMNNAPNYLGDAGGSSPSGGFRFLAPADSDFLISVNTVQSTAVGNTFSFTVSSTPEPATRPCWPSAA